MYPDPGCLGIWYHGAVAPHIIYGFVMDTRKYLNNKLKGRYIFLDKSQTNEIKRKSRFLSFWPHPLPDGYWEHGKKFIYRNNWFPLAESRYQTLYLTNHTTCTACRPDTSALWQYLCSDICIKLEKCEELKLCLYLTLCRWLLPKRPQPLLFTEHSDSRILTLQS